MVSTYFRNNTTDGITNDHMWKLQRIPKLLLSHVIINLITYVALWISENVETRTISQYKI